MRKVSHISIEDALELHAVVLGLTRGTLGVRDMGGLSGSLERAKTAFGGKEMFPGVFDKAAAYIESVARNHSFLDGNKRTAYLIGAAFLHRNGYDLAPKQGEIEMFVLWVVTEKPAFAEIAAWLKKRSRKKK
jgi:death-on-curing protein